VEPNHTKANKPSYINVSIYVHSYMVLVHVLLYTVQYTRMYCRKKNILNMNNNLINFTLQLHIRQSYTVQRGLVQRKISREIFVMDWGAHNALTFSS
jgi:hypothetical protein